ncbi:hypothetical protein H1R16_03865 [Marnyiella aurantia]|uniref:YceI family protein n=1 Tax=Marnyiella aurantia TaxID=2758037 RepID=A0A7D7RLH6_9FLAO|nr:hypothetical protein [Marnyiella aurantia]MBA5247394.1 hypothetical protein [Marnyiella aurantia]QMS99152.1 hypothetical protein H1R16_03865 [Marnyiella aurantia]
MMKNTVILILLLISGLLPAQENTVEILGKTNVNTFKCTNTSIAKPAGSFSSETKLPVLQLKVADFDCRNKMMTNDFRKILNSEQHPHFTVRFIEFKKNANSYYSAIVEVKILNRKRFYTVTFFENKNMLTGNETVRFSDFGIVPPTKMGGTIVVKDHLELTMKLKNL